ncbi:hypothetical protein K458DRAFT_406642 [Lentithecium fluviatile CBS 122367]|uniref:Uncharacterized protein n=1 Tax=Lentithecium fluviatile CBS 122367 TaxID=1168545 RepID=A0A6G1ISS0_9PLEO|nr:hypothetical protein K458DRAFT_406642 [Lentithecium fluviatile CBS 122367]
MDWCQLEELLDFKYSCAPYILTEFRVDTSSSSLRLFWFIEQWDRLCSFVPEQFRTFQWAFVDRLRLCGTTAVFLSQGTSSLFRTSPVESADSTMPSHTERRESTCRTPALTVSRELSRNSRIPVPSPTPTNKPHVCVSAHKTQSITATARTSKVNIAVAINTQ